MEKGYSLLLTIEPIDPLHPDAIQLLHEAAREVRPLYGDIQDSNASLPNNAHLGPRSVYLIARNAETPVGSAALRPLDKDVGEIRRMYVIPSFRGKGVGRALLDTIERTALDMRYSILRLETGNRQPAAIALYESSGYQHIPRFGEYTDDPTSVCYEKMLSSSGLG